jgi:hypothetical protein
MSKSGKRRGKAAEAKARWGNATQGKDRVELFHDFAEKIKEIKQILN